MQVVYEQFEFNSKKNLFIFVCLVNKSSSSSTLGLIIKRDKFKHNNVFVIILMNMRAQII